MDKLHKNATMISLSGILALVYVASRQRYDISADAALYSAHNERFVCFCRSAYKRYRKLQSSFNLFTNNYKP